jgi:uncharacterized protein
LDLAGAALLTAAAFAAGAINALAGGGTLVSFPGLLIAGYSPKVANVTNTVAVFPGFLGSSFAYREELALQPQNIKTVLPPAILGAIVGSAILLSTPESTFSTLVPFLILGACGLLAFQGRIAQLVRRTIELGPHPNAPTPVLWVVLFAITIYGAYFGAGMGIILLAALGLLLPDDMQHSNALRAVIALVVNGLAAGYFALFGNVAWEAAGIMAVATVIGGYAGGRLARRLETQTLRRAVIAYGTIAAVILLVR